MFFLPTPPLFKIFACSDLLLSGSLALKSGCSCRYEAFELSLSASHWSAVFSNEPVETSPQN